MVWLLLFNDLLIPLIYNLLLLFLLPLFTASERWRALSHVHRVYVHLTVGTASVAETSRNLLIQHLWPRRKFNWIYMITNIVHILLVNVHRSCLVMLEICLSFRVATLCPLVVWAHDYDVLVFYLADCRSITLCMTLVSLIHDVLI